MKKINYKTIRSQMFIRIFSLFLFPCSLLFLTACSTPQLTSQTRTGLLGTVITISSYDHISDELYDECFDTITNMDTSVLTDRATHWHTLSNGAFDITIGATTTLWEHMTRLPSEEEIAQALTHNDILDFGAIAKGYACDLVVNILKENGITNAVLDFGGDVYVYGNKPNATPWKIGIRIPLRGENGYFGTIRLTEGAVATSGNYEKYLEVNGNFYHHILDPKTGYPADNDLNSVTVIADNATDADAISTACFVLGLEEGMRFITEINQNAVFVTKDNKVHSTIDIEIADSRFSIP